MFNIAFNTFKELTRNKILYLILFFAILLIFFSIALASLSLWQTEKITLDFWLSMIEIFWLVSVIFIGSQLIFKEIEWKTIYLILSKPISRFEFILWKFIGFAMILACIVFFQAAIFLLVLKYSWSQLDTLIIFSIIFIYLKLAVLFAVILFFSTFISSIMSIILTILVYIIAHWITSIIDMAISTKNGLLEKIWWTIYYVFPNFESLNIKNLIGSSIAIWPEYLLLNSLYAILYCFMILVFTVVIFNRKTFES